jgi:hypothetical protein
LFSFSKILQLRNLQFYCDIFDSFVTIETDRVLYFAKHETTKLSAFCRALN